MQVPDTVEMLVGDEWVPASLLDLEKGDTFRIPLPDGSYWEDSAGDTEFRVTKSWGLEETEQDTTDLATRITIVYDNAA